MSNRPGFLFMPHFTACIAPLAKIPLSFAVCLIVISSSLLEKIIS